MKPADWGSNPHRPAMGNAFKNALKRLSDTKKKVIASGVAEKAVNAATAHTIAAYIATQKIPLYARFLVNKEMILTAHKECLDYITEKIGGRPGQTVQETIDALVSAMNSERASGKSVNSVDRAINECFLEFIQKYNLFVRRVVLAHYTSCLDNTVAALEHQYNGTGF